MEHHIGVVVGGAEGAGWEDAGGIGATVAVDAVAAGRGAGGCRQRSAGQGGGEEVASRRVGAGGVVRGDIGRVGGDRDGCRQGHGLPAARPRVAEGGAGELRAGCAPQIKKIRAGVARAAVELEGGDLAGNRGRELYAHFKRRAVIVIGLRRRVGCGEETHRRGRHRDIEWLAGGETAKIGGRSLDAERADIPSPRCAAERARRSVERQPCRQRRAVGGGCRVGENVAGIDIGEGAGGQHQGEGRADNRVLAAGLGCKHRRVIGAMNGDRERRRGCGAGRIAHGVGEHIGQRVGRLPQRLYGGIRLVDGVGEGAGSVEHKAAVRPAERCAKRACRRAELDGDDGLGVAHVGVGVVGEDIAGGRRAARAVGDPALLGGIGRVGNSRRWRVQRRRHRDIECLAGGETAKIGGRSLDAERADIPSPRCAAERARRSVERQPCRQRRAVGGGCRVGENVAGIDIGEGAGGQHQGEGRADNRVLAAGLGCKHRRVIGAMNGDRERRRGCGAGRIAHGVGEHIGQRVGRLPQRLYGGIRLVDGVGEGAGGVEHKAAVRPAERCAKRACRRAELDGDDGLGVAHVGVGVVGEDIAGGRRAARAVGDPALLGGIGRVGNSRRWRVDSAGEYHIGVVVGGAVGAGREDAGGIGATVAVDAVAAGRGGGGCRQRSAGQGRGEEVVGRHIGAGGVIGGDIGRVGGDRDGCRQGHGLPAARPRVAEGGAGQLRAGCAPQVKKVRAGVAGAAVELEGGDLAGNRGR